MHWSWLREEFTLYTRIVLTASCWRNGKSRWQASGRERGSMKLEGSPKGLLALATTAPTTISKMRAPVWSWTHTLLLICYTFDVETASIFIVEISPISGYLTYGMQNGSKESENSSERWGSEPSTHYKWVGRRMVTKRQAIDPQRRIKLAHTT